MRLLEKIFVFTMIICLVPGTNGRHILPDNPSTSVQGLGVEKSNDKNQEHNSINKSTDDNDDCFDDLSGNDSDDDGDGKKSKLYKI